MQKKDCLFCKIERKEAPAEIVYEDELCYAIMDLFPAGYGHVLVIPREHYENYMETEDETLGHLLKVAKMIAHAQEKTFNNEGNRIVINCKEVGGQKVFHTHVHVIPKYASEISINKETLNIQSKKMRDTLKQ